jgi:hypothetical protein
LSYAWPILKNITGSRVMSYAVAYSRAAVAWSPRAKASSAAW